MSEKEAMGIVMKYLSDQPKHQIIFLLTWFMGQTFNMEAVARSEYIPLLLGIPLKKDERLGLLYIYFFLHLMSFSLVMIKFLSNVAELQGFIRRRLGSLLLACQCSFLITHLIAKGDDHRVMAISGVSTMVISGVKLVATPRDSSAVALLYLVNSAIAYSFLILSNSGHLCPAALKALIPALTAIPALFIDKVYMAITGHAKKE